MVEDGVGNHLMFAPVGRCVPSEQEKRVRIPLKSLERLCGNLCEK
jgi:hypothetical protein